MKQIGLFVLGILLFTFISCNQELSEKDIYGKWIYDFSNNQYMEFKKDGTVLVQDLQGSDTYEWILYTSPQEDYIDINGERASIEVDHDVMRISFVDEQNPTVLYRQD